MSTNALGANAPDGIGEQHLRSAAAWRRHASPLSLGIFGAVLVLGFAGFLGHERDWEATGEGATLAVHMPEVIRNGEFFEIRINVESDEPITELVIGIDQAIWEDITVNTLIPAATEESSEDGEFRFTFAELSAGTAFLFKIDAQLNPDIVGGNAGSITLYDGETLLAETEIAMTVLP
jgi:hypothetical protein